MRFSLFAIALLPCPALADVIVQPSRATQAVIHPNAALVTHAMALTLPAGSHQIVLPDMPPELYLDALRISAPGLQLGALRYRDDLTPPRPQTETMEVKTAKDRIKAIEARIETVNDTAARQQLAVDAAEARIQFLTNLGTSEALPGDVESLRNVSRMVGEETLDARNSALDAQEAARRTRKALEDLEKELNNARADLAALIPEPEDRPLLVVDVSSPTDLTDAPFSVTFLAEANWQPTYDFRLSDGETGQLVIERGARVSQSTGENWQDIALTLSTQNLSNQMAPSIVPQNPRRIGQPAEVQLQSRAKASYDSTAMEAPMMAEEAQGMVASEQGLALVYAYSSPVSVASGADMVQLPFDSQTIKADIFARAAPLHDNTAFLMARFTLDTGEPLLATNQAAFFFDGGLIGINYFPGLVDGEETEMGFGPIDGLQLTRKVLNRNEGDRGLINRSNEITERTQIELSNLTGRSWPVELRDRVPYSEQEDLQITYSANPRPNVQDVEDRRGILEWHFDMAAGAKQTITIDQKLTWPEGQVLR